MVTKQARLDCDFFFKYLKARCLVETFSTFTKHSHNTFFLPPPLLKQYVHWFREAQVWNLFFSSIGWHSYWISIEIKLIALTNIIYNYMYSCSLVSLLSSWMTPNTISDHHMSLTYIHIFKIILIAFSYTLRIFKHAFWEAHRFERRNINNHIYSFYFWIQDQMFCFL